MPDTRVALRGRIRAWALALALAAAICAWLAPAAEALPNDFWGVVPQAIPSYEEFHRLREGGVETIRIPIYWAVVQRSEHGPYNWSGIDRLVAGAAGAGLDVLPAIDGAPPWVVPTDSRYGSPETLPIQTQAEKDAWTEFLTAVVDRYGPNGSFWADNPALPKRPIRTWQIWNEENFEYFVAQPNPIEYGRLVKVSAATIRGLDPRATIILGGMFARPKEATYDVRPREAYFATDFLRQMYRHVAGIRSAFQGVALHPYTRIYQYLGPEIREVRAVMRANRDATKGLWITEMGWSSEEGGNLFAKGPAGQAAQLRGAFRVLRQNQRRWRIQRVYWFSVEDELGACNFCDGSGLFSEGFEPKPAWSAFVHFTGGTP